MWAELQKDFFCPVSGFSTKKCPNYLFAAIIQHMKFNKCLFSSHKQIENHNELHAAVKEQFKKTTWAIFEYLL